MVNTKQAYFTIGLPGAGKTWWLERFLGRFPDLILVSADNYKDELFRDAITNTGFPFYTVIAPSSKQIGEMHQQSVELAEERVYELLGKNKSFIMDGGGINNRYTHRIMTKCKAAGYHVKLVHFDTPAEVCIARNRERNRDVPVPESAIIEKAVKLNECMIRYQNLVHDIITIEYYKNREIFVDMDGTMCAYQHIPLDGDGCIDFIAGRYFFNALPVQPVIDKLAELHADGARLHILSAAPDNHCMDDKLQWLDMHADGLFHANDIHFIGNKRYKDVMLRNICKKRKFEYRDVAFVDDDHGVITACQKLGINAVHPSMFLTNKFQTWKNQ